jgi:hypothetical protein
LPGDERTGRANNCRANRAGDDNWTHRGRDAAFSNFLIALSASTIFLLACDHRCNPLRLFSQRP